MEASAPRSPVYAGCLTPFDFPDEGNLIPMHKGGEIVADSGEGPKLPLYFLTKLRPEGPKKMFF